MKLFDYDAHAHQNAKRLSNPNVTANLKINSVENVVFKKAKFEFYFPNENGDLYNFIDSVDSFESSQNLSLFTNDSSNSFYYVEDQLLNFYFDSTKQFVVSNKDRIQQEIIENCLVFTGEFNEINLNIKKSPTSNIQDDVYIYVKCSMTRIDNKQAFLWARILLKSQQSENNPNITITYFVE